MDEYLFLTLARLKADRLKLEREQRGAEPREQLRLEGFSRVSRGTPPAVLDEAHSLSVDTRRRSARQPAVSRWFSQQPLWREQS